jgi:hypothetical protein
VASETISDAKLYTRFFDLLDRYLDNVKSAPEAQEEVEVNGTTKTPDAVKEAK